MIDAVLTPLQYSFMRYGLLAAVLVSISCGTLGLYVVTRRMAFIGDALAHTILPGLVLAYLFGVSLFIGALASGLVMAFGVGWFSRRGKVHEDSAIGILFSGMFALGIVMMHQQRTFRDLSHMLFGNLLGVTPNDLALMGGSTLIVVVLLTTFHKELVLTSYDPDYAESIGLDPDRVRYLLLVLLALAVVSAIQAVGVILTSALLITPAASAGLLTRRVCWITILAVAIALVSSVAGLYLSYYAELAAGASIVLTATALFGVAWIVSWWRSRVVPGHPDH